MIAIIIPATALPNGAEIDYSTVTFTYAADAANAFVADHAAVTVTNGGCTRTYSVTCAADMSAS